MKCPKCPEPLQRVGTQGQALSCPRGDGYLVPRAELERLLAEGDADRLTKGALGSATPTHECPACGERMRRVRVVAPERCDVDACPACRATWLDAGEVERLREGGVRVRRDRVPNLPDEVVLFGAGFALGAFFSE